jgi:copper chaperone
MNSKDTLLDVQGMSCPSCISHVNAALTDLDGVTKVEVRLRNGKVLIEHDPMVAPVESLIEALGEAGYESKPSAAA